MQLFERILTHNNKKQQKPSRVDDSDTIASSTSTTIVKDNNKKKRTFSFRTICWRLNNKRNKKQDVCVSTEENQVLLTQCIETALFIPPPISPIIPINNKRWSLEEKRSIGFIDTQPQPQPQEQQTRQRKLSLPAQQYSNIGYLASIPEVDSFTE
jgi:hypothetical protein